MASFFEDVIRNDPRFNSVKRVADIDLLEPVTRSAVSRIVEDARALGIDLMVFETYRSQVRQQELFNQGASKLRVVGVHHFGLAVDLVKVVGGEPSWKGDFSFLGRLAHEHGLIWGGDWGDPQCPIPSSMPFTCSGAPYLYNRRFFEALSTPMQTTTLIGRRVQP